MTTALPPTHKQLSELPDKMAETTRALASHILQIDTQLQKVDALMNDLQPPITGKMRIEWYESQGKIYPTPVLWKRTKQHKWRAERVSVKNLVSRVRTARQFHFVSRKMKTLAKEAVALIALRRQALERIATFNRSVGSLLSYAKPKIEYHSRRLDIWRPQVKREWDLRDK